MSKITLFESHQQEPEFICFIDQLLNKYSLKNITQKTKNLNLVNLYQIFEQLSKPEKIQFFANLSTSQQADFERLITESNPVIKHAQTKNLLVVDSDNQLSIIKDRCFAVSETINNQPIIVLDAFKTCIGIIELHTLLTSPDDMLAYELVKPITELHVSEKETNAANIMANNNDHFALLVDSKKTVIGLLCLVDIIKKTEPINNPPYLQIPVLHHVRQRIFWVLALAVVGLLSGIIIQSYDDAITALIVLAFYMPMVADTGGNAGSQAATVIIRSIALGELSLKNWFSIIYKELRIALFIGLGLACVSYLKIYFLSYGIELPDGLTLQVIAFAIALALFIQVLSATLIGASLPLLVKWFNQDPAVVASPAITTIVDVTGLLIYFYVTSSLLFY